MPGTNQFHFMDVVSNLLCQQNQFMVSMLGTSGVGKTSMLTAMLDEFTHILAGSGMELAVANPQDVALLQQQRGQLEEHFRQNTARVFPVVKGSKEGRWYNFTLGRIARRHELKITFVDYPGGWIEPEAAPQDTQKVITVLKQSSAILIPVDAPALLEGNGTWHQEQNSPAQMNHMLIEAFRDMVGTRLVIFAPIRCERYMNMARYECDLVDAVKRGYDTLLRNLAHPSLKDRVAVVVTPIQTLGQIVYDGNEDDPKENPSRSYMPYFIRQSTQATYSPQFCDQPLRYLLRFILRRTVDQNMQGFWARVRLLFQSDAHLFHTARCVAQGCYTSDGFAIMQGDHLLNLTFVEHR